MGLRTLFQPSEALLTIQLGGKLTNEEEMKKILIQLDKQLSKVQGRLIYDVKELQHINSGGINFFIRSLTKTRVHGGDMVLVGANGFVEKLFIIAKMDEVFTLKPNLDEALNFFNLKK